MTILCASCNEKFAFFYVSNEEGENRSHFCLSCLKQTSDFELLIRSLYRQTSAAKSVPFSYAADQSDQRPSAIASGDYEAWKEASNALEGAKQQVNDAMKRIRNHSIH